jgi:hypothetical protein
MSAEDAKPAPLMPQELYLPHWMRGTSPLGVHMQLDRDAVPRRRCCAASTARSLFAVRWPRSVSQEPQKSSLQEVFVTLCGFASR